MTSVTSLAEMYRPEFSVSEPVHCKLRAQLHQVNLCDSATCRCEALKQTPEHILQDLKSCQTEDIRLKGAAIKDKLWGTSE